MSLLFDALKHAQQSNADNLKQQEPALDSTDQLVDQNANLSVAPSATQTEPTLTANASSAKGNIAGTQAAQAIFSATTQPPRSRLAILILVFLALLISFAGAWFYLQTPEDEVIEPNTPPVATPPTNTTNKVVNAAARPANTSEPNTASFTTPSKGNITTNKETGKQTPASITKTDSKINSATGSTRSPLKAGADKNNAKQASFMPKTADDIATPLPKPKPTPTQNQKNNTHTNNAPVTLTANTNPDPLKEAYTALTEGKLDESERKYLGVITKRPNEKDALLGLAIIAHRKSQTSRALDLYQQVLREDPENTHATAGLLSLSAAADPVAAESHLKQALDLKQTSPELHYALGNLLARQKRWSEAQQAFFRAANLAPNNTLYTYNLAVALDHLGKSNVAIASYEKTLQLIKQDKQEDNTINRNAIQKRIQELRKFLLNNTENGTGSP